MMKSNVLRFEFLFDARFFEIENLELHFRKRRQLLRRAGEKRGRDIAENVGVQAALEQRQDLRANPPVPAPISKNAQTATFRQVAGTVLTAAAMAASQWLVKRPSP